VQSNHHLDDLLRLDPRIIAELSTPERTPPGFINVIAELWIRGERIVAILFEDEAPVAIHALASAVALSVDIVEEEPTACRRSPSSAAARAKSLKACARQSASASGE
jgi:hypothetical protein